MNRTYHFSCFTSNSQDPRKRVIYVCNFSLFTFLNHAALRRRLFCILLTSLSCWPRSGYIPYLLPYSWLCMATFLANGLYNQNPCSHPNNLTVNMHPVPSTPKMKASCSSEISVPMYNPKSIKPQKLHQLLLSRCTLIYGILHYFKFGFKPLVQAQNLN
jgi:hypothetical protein